MTCIQKEITISSKSRGFHSITEDVISQFPYLGKFKDSLVIGQPWENDERIILFLKMKDQSVLSEELIKQIKKSIRESCSPRHVPAKIIAVADIPYTINGKKVELAVKQVIQNIEVKNKDSLVNPNSLKFYKKMMELEE